MRSLILNISPVLHHHTITSPCGGWHRKTRASTGGGGYLDNCTQSELSLSCSSRFRESWKLCEQKAVLGHDKKVAALQQGNLKENMIATPWKHLEPLLKRKGIDTETL